MRPAFGDWRSLVAHFVRDEGVGGSNPLSPTKFRKTQPYGWVFCFLRPKEDENLRGWRFDSSVARERCAATARRASHAVASHPLSPTKFRKTQPQGWVFCFLRPQVLRPHNCLMAASPYQAYAIQQYHQFRRPDKRSRAIRQNHDSAANPSVKNQNPLKLCLSLLPAA